MGLVGAGAQLVEDVVVALAPGLPKRLLLALRVVLALPRASKMGLAAITRLSTAPRDPPTVAKNLRAYLADTVLPAPDSPLTTTDWFSLALAMFL